MVFRKPEPTDKMDDHAEQHSHAFDEISNLKDDMDNHSHDYASSNHTHDAGVPISGRRFKYSTSSGPSNGYFYIGPYDAIFSFVDQSGIVRKMTNGPEFQMTNVFKMTVWDMDGKLALFAEMRNGSNYSSTHMKLYIDKIRYDRGLVGNQLYDVTVEGYW